MTWKVFLISLALAAIPTIAAAVIPQGRWSRRETLDRIKAELDIAERISGTPEAEWLRGYARARVRQYGLDATRRQNRRIAQSNEIAFSYLTEPEKRAHKPLVGTFGLSLVFTAVAYFTGPRFLESRLSYTSLTWWIGMAVVLLVGLKLLYWGISRAFWPWKYLRADPIAQLHDELVGIDELARPPHPESPSRVGKIDMVDIILRQHARGRSKVQQHSGGPAANSRHQRQPATAVRAAKRVHTTSVARRVPTDYARHYRHTQLRVPTHVPTSKRASPVRGAVESHQELQ